MRSRSFPTTSRHDGGGGGGVPVKSQQTRLAVLVSFTGRRAAPRNSFRFAPGCKRRSRDVRGEERKRSHRLVHALCLQVEKSWRKNDCHQFAALLLVVRRVFARRLSSHHLLQAPGAADRAAMMSTSQKDVKKGRCRFILKIFASTYCSGHFIRDTWVLHNHFFLKLRECVL